MTETYISGIGMVPALKALGKDLTIVEIGVCRGVNLKYLVEACPNIKLFVGVDPWHEYPEMTQQYLDECYEQAVVNLREHVKSQRVRIIRDFSVNAARQFADNSLDGIYVDGEHTEPAVERDLNVWIPKVKPGGLVAGHDWCLAAVRAVVNRWLEKSPVHLQSFHLVEHSSWYFTKG